MDSNNNDRTPEIAVIGTGIAGLTSAWLLSRNHNVTVFEANDYIGGHTHTVGVEIGNEAYNVDTGFIVCNDRNYPHFLQMMDQLGVPLQPTQMSFSVRNDALDLEYNGHNLNTLFSQRRNLVRPKFIRLVADILRFNKAARSVLAADTITPVTLAQFTDDLKLNSTFRDNYLLPMVAAIWSCSLQQAGQCPLQFFLRFFQHHGLLDIANRPQWFVLQGGSHSYIEPITQSFAGRIRLESKVTRVKRGTDKVEVVTATGSESFDQVVLACHSDQALNLLADPTAMEREILGDLEYQTNHVLLHSDASIMPRNKLSWASWNVLADTGRHTAGTRVTYCMNILQNIRSETPLLVSLNAADNIREEKVLQEFYYDHPVYSRQSMSAQARRSEICGKDKIHYCGAYWYNGFHEDGVRSALDVCSRFGEYL